MEREEIQKIIISLCQDMGSPIDLDGIEPEDIGELSLSSDVGLDTVDKLELMFGLQDGIDADIEEDQFDECETIDDVCDYIISLLF